MVLDAPNRSITAVEHEYTIGASYYGGLDEHPTAQNVPATYEEFVNARAELSFKKLRRSIGAVEYEKGIRWDLGLYSNYVPKEFDATAPAQQRREDLALTNSS